MNIFFPIFSYLKPTEPLRNPEQLQTLMFLSDIFIFDIQGDHYLERAKKQQKTELYLNTADKTV